MANKKKRKINSSAIIIFILSTLVITGFVLIFSNPTFWFKKSIHEDAKKYTTRHCLVFYPDNDYGKKVAKQLAQDVKEDIVYDYSLVPCGDYYLVSYGNGVEYYVDSNYNSIEVNEVSDFGKRIIVDYLRYTIKKQDPDKYYDADFLSSLTIDNISFEDVVYGIKNEYLSCKLKDYEYELLVPLKYMQNEIGMNFGYTDEQYVKPTYIDLSGKHPVICLTFDDGPSLWEGVDDCSSAKIVDTLYKYDATATFYVVNYALEERDEWTDYQLYSFLNKSINNGNEYGSHTANHDTLTEIASASKIEKVIKEPANFLKDLVDYDVVTYRPPGGSFDEDVLNAQPYAAILWNADSDDWYSRDPKKIYNNVMKYEYYDGDVILFHDIYASTAEAVEKIVPALINQGYQLVTVKDMLQYAKIDVNTLQYYYNLNPSPYYE